MPHRVRLRDSSIPETARLIRDQQSLRWGLALRMRHSRHYREAISCIVPISDMPITACGPPNPTQLRILDVALDEDFSLLSVRAHYMRGPGPKWREKHARSARFTSYTGQLSAAVPAPPVALRDLTPWLGM